MGEIKLPPLPRRAGLDDHRVLPEPGFSHDQMTAYATEAERMGFMRGLEAARAECERIEDEYQRREGGRYPELKSDAQTGASDCEYAIRSLAATKQGGSDG